MILHARLAILTSAVWLVAGVSAAQPVAPQASARASAIARGWTALAAGRPAEALEAVRVLTQNDPADHHALVVALEAHRTAGNPTAALDAYERWFAAARHEDVFLLRPVALSFLTLLAGSSDPMLRSKSLEALVTAGDENAVSALSALAAGPAGQALSADLAMAVRGNAAARMKLQEKLRDPQTRNRPVALQDPAIDAVVPIELLVELLEDPEPLTRAAAADALGRRSGDRVTAALRKALEDRTGLVRLRASFALARLGEADQVAEVRELVAGDRGETRVMAARVLADTGHTGWEEAVRAELTDENPVARLAAAGLLVNRPEYRSDALAVLMAGLGDSNPAVQQQAAALAGPYLADTDLAGLRRLLRNANGWVKYNAAAALTARDDVR